MHNTVVILKDGRTLEGPVWTFRPIEGWFSMPAVTEERIHFRDVVSAVTYEERVSATEVGVEVDLLARALREGWDGTR